MRRGVLALALALVVGLSGWGISRGIAQHQMDEEMAMMKKMMESRPKSLKNADKTVQSEKQKLMKAGKYGCCLKHGCDQCVLKMGGCPCGMNAAAGKPVCHECKGGWEAGDGAIPGKKASDIKVMPRMGMDMKMGKAGDGATKLAGIQDIWRCPMTGEKVEKGQEAGTPVVVANYRVHFCCAGCPESFAKLSAGDQKAKVLALAKK